MPTIASSTTPNSWTVTPNMGSATVTAPGGASSATGYTIRWKTGFGMFTFNFSASFDLLGGTDVPASASTVRALAPDMAAIVQVDRPGVIVTAAGDGGYDCVSRYFAPANRLKKLSAFHVGRAVSFATRCSSVMITRSNRAQRVASVIERLPKRRSAAIFAASPANPIGAAAATKPEEQVTLNKNRSGGISRSAQRF